ncbi:glycosyltransferase [Acidithiobacillus ferrivorans]|nr:glycosyltransferase [Acidithiobacillus ferrivorans]
MPILQPILLIPAHNEASTLPTVLARWCAHAPNTPLCLVLDQCIDDSAKQTDAFFEQHQGLPLQVICTVPHHNGKTGAILQGAWALLQRGYPHDTPIVLWDADGEYDLAALPEILSTLSALTSTQYLLSGIRTGSRLKRSILANSLVRQVLRYRFSETPDDILTGVHAMPLIALLLGLQGASRFTMETALVRHALRNEIQQVTVPVPYHPRLEGKKISAWDLPGILWVAAR